MYRFHSSMVEHPHSIRGGPGSIPGRCSSIFGIWREVLGRNVYIISQYFFPAIMYRDIISHITSTYRYIMYFFRTFKKSTVPYKVHNMGLRYIKNNINFTDWQRQQWCTLICKYLRKCSKNSKQPLWDTQGLGGDLFMKKPAVENFVALSL